MSNFGCVELRKVIKKNVVDYLIKLIETSNDAEEIIDGLYILAKASIGHRKNEQYQASIRCALKWQTNLDVSVQALIAISAFAVRGVAEAENRNRRLKLKQHDGFQSSKKSETLCMPEWLPQDLSDIYAMDCLTTIFPAERKLDGVVYMALANLSICSQLHADATVEHMWGFITTHKEFHNRSQSISEHRLILIKNVAKHELVGANMNAFADSIMRTVDQNKCSARIVAIGLQAWKALMDNNEAVNELPTQRFIELLMPFWLKGDRDDRVLTYFLQLIADFLSNSRQQRFEKDMIFYDRLSITLCECLSKQIKNSYISKICSVCLMELWARDLSSVERLAISDLLPCFARILGIIAASNDIQEFPIATFQLIEYFFKLCNENTLQVDSVELQQDAMTVRSLFILHHSLQIYHSALRCNNPAIKDILTSIIGLWKIQ